MQHATEWIFLGNAAILGFQSATKSVVKVQHATFVGEKAEILKS
jgi:hypothetical protein